MKKGTIIHTTYNRYAVVKKLGEGGVGEVYEVTDSDGRSFALKVFKSGLDSAKAKRFKNEINFCKITSHPNVVKVFDDGFVLEGDCKYLFYVMPLYKTTLRFLMKQKLEPSRALKYFGDMLNGVEAAHLQKVWHRDLKPENFLYDEDNDRILLADFGAAHFSEQFLLEPVATRKGDRLANFAYPSPEQRSVSSAVDHRSDIFSLGLIFNEMITGTPPHGTSHPRIADVDRNFDFLDTLVHKMLSSSPADRPQSIDEIKQQISIQSELSLSRQRISKLSNTVIQETEIDDAIYNDPIRALKFDYTLHNGGALDVQLNRPVSQVWKNVFFKSGASVWSSSVHWGGADFHGDHAYIPVPMEQAEQAKRFFQQWLDNTNRIYRDEIARSHREQLETEKRLLEQQLAQEKKRAELVARLNNA